MRRTEKIFPSPIINFGLRLHPQPTHRDFDISIFLMKFFNTLVPRYLFLHAPWPRKLIS